MKLHDLIKQSNQIAVDFKIADEAFDNRNMELLTEHRETLNSMATYLTPRTHTDAAFFCNLIEENAAFLGDGPTFEADGTKAINAIGRMAKSLHAYMQRPEAA